MHTQAEAQRYKTYFTPFIQQCADYRDLLAKQGLSLTTDLEKIKSAYRRQLFDKLLEIDQPRKMRYEMLCTDEGKERLIKETIDIAGHPIIDEISALLSSIEAGYKQIDLPRSGPLHRELPLSSFAEYHKLDLAKIIDSRTVNWKGSEHVLAYFEGLTGELTRLRNLAQTLIVQGASMHEVGAILHQCFNIDIETKKVVVDELSLYQHVLLPLSKRGAANNFPNNMR